jgi:protease-4
MDSSVTPNSPEQWAELNAQADAINADFKRKVAAGRKLSLDKVQEIARGRVWTGDDALTRGLVDRLGGFWTAADMTRRLAKIAPGERISFKRFPRRKSFFEALSETFGDSSATARAFQGLVTLLNSPLARAVVDASQEAPRGGTELRAVNLPR